MFWLIWLVAREPDPLPAKPTPAAPATATLLAATLAVIL